MRDVEHSSRFTKDYRRELKNPNNRDLDDRFIDVIDLLKADQALPIHLNDHPLHGEYADMRSCHIKPDLLIIYMKIGDHTLRLVRMGSHSNLY